MLFTTEKRTASNFAPQKPAGALPSVVRKVLNSPGKSLDAQTRSFFEHRFQHDFSQVRIHADSEAAGSARDLNAQAYVVGSDVAFASGRFNPSTSAGRKLLAHELTHVVQQGGRGEKVATGPSTPAGGEAEADRVADAISLGTARPSIGRVRAGQLQQKVEMRDVGKGEQSGFADLPKLIDRLNTMSEGLKFSMNGKELNYALRPGGTVSGFDNQMKGFIDQDPVIPLRLTNRHGLLGDREHGFHEGVLVDAWSSGYVDIDDLLASSDLGLQEALVHFLRERTETKNYAGRIGSKSMDLSDPDAAPQKEFDRAHGKGLQAELQLFRDFFNDQTIEIVPGAESGDISRVFQFKSAKQGERVRILSRVKSGRGAQTGVDAVSVEVEVKQGKKITKFTPEEYKKILEEESVARQVKQERLSGATEHVEGGRRVPAP